MSPLQLPGRIEPRPRAGAAAPVYVALLTLAILGGGLVWLLRPSPSTPPALPTSVQAASPLESQRRDREAADDGESHLENARAQLTKASEQLVRAERALNALGPSLDRNYLLSEHQRANTASIACTTARAAIEHALSELRVVTLNRGGLQ